MTTFKFGSSTARTLNGANVRGIQFGGFRDLALAFFMLTTFYLLLPSFDVDKSHNNKNNNVDSIRAGGTATDLQTLAKHLSDASNKIGNNHDNDNNDGWVNIQVFAGDNKILYQRAHNKWFSQVHQDKIVAALLRDQKQGYFVDLAAHDAVHFSNTLALEKNLAWTGLCIEANPDYWRDLSFRNCRVIGAAVGKERMAKVKFSLNEEFGGIVGKEFDNKEVEKHPYRKKDGDLEFYTVPLLEVLQRNQVPSVIDYMSLDVEGAELFIMRDFPFAVYTIRILTVERPKSELRSLLESNGYTLLKIISHWGETLWIHKSAMSSIDVDALAGFKIPQYNIAEAIPE